ncbi:MAG: hypothetical protein ACLFM4_10760 [Phormidium sp.]|nr:MAG: hypothetical protein HLUCCO16_16930 [Phormidium sp. OSCR]
MLKQTILLGCLLIISNTIPVSASPVLALEEPTMMLPEEFTVTVQDANGRSVQRVLPTVNRYQGEDGGYIAFYSRNPEIGVYSVGGGIYVVGQVRLQGEYWGRIFQPAGYEGEDISAEQVFKDLADEIFPQCNGGCWAGGDTGGWLGR